MKNMTDTKNDIRIFSDPQQMVEAAAEHFYHSAVSAHHRSGCFSVALSGGSTPRKLHRRFCEKPYILNIPWKSTHIFWVDERMVPYDHPESNFGASKKDFLDKLSLPPDHVHPMPISKNRNTLAKQYQLQLKTYFSKQNRSEPVFDLILLGIGTDGHVASLFPENPFSGTSNQWVITARGGDPHVWRLTLNYAILNSAKEILFLISGVGKASVVESLFENPSKKLPAHRIRPLNGKITYLMDQEAASRINFSGKLCRPKERI
jgi:6-phosphogluconolactonase